MVSSASCLPQKVPETTVHSGGRSHTLKGPNTKDSSSRCISKSDNITTVFLQTAFLIIIFLSKLLQGLCQWALGFGYHVSLFSGNTPHFKEPVPEKQASPATRTATTVCTPSLLWLAPSQNEEGGRNAVFLPPPESQMLTSQPLPCPIKQPRHLC